MFSLMHLWLLYYLFLLSLLATLFGQRSEKILLETFQGLHLQRLSFQNLQMIALVTLPLLLVPAVMISGTPVPTPESFRASLWPLLFYGCFYFTDWMPRGRETAIKLTNRGIFLLCVLTVAGFSVHYLFHASSRSKNRCGHNLSSPRLATA